MEKTDTGYKWKQKQVRLGYFCYKVYDTPRPITALEKYFNISKLSSSITQASYNVKRADTKKWRAELDEIFLD